MNDIQKRNRALVQACDQSGLLDRLCTQREARRIRAYYLDGNPLRDISEQEGVTASVVCRSIFAKTYCKTEDGPKFEPGQLVWVVERDMDGNAYGPSGYVFLAQVAYAAIVTPQINGVKDLSYAVDWHIRETCFSQATDGLSVFPIKDCYGTSDEAKAAKTAEEEGKHGTVD